MPKRDIKSHRRRKLDEVSHFSNLTGGGDDVADANDALGDCLAELQQSGPVDVSDLPSDRGPAESVNATSISRTSTNGPNQKRPRASTPVASWMRRSYMGPGEIESWNQSFRAWADGGSAGSSGGHGLYAPGLLPNLDQEIARNFKVKELSTLLLKAGGKQLDLRMPVFERWLLDSKYEEDHRIQRSGTLIDPVLPRTASPDSKSSQRLLLELVAASKQKQSTGGRGMEQDEAERIVAELCRKTNLACQELLSQHERYRKQSPLKKGDRIQLEGGRDGKSSDAVTILYSRKKWKKPFCFKLNKIHYQKLKERFVGVHTNKTFSSNGASSPLSSLWPPPLCQQRDMVERSFHVLVMALLLRYSAMSGGQLLEDLRGGGMQGAIHSQVFQVLQSHFSSSTNCWLEGFASPFNATLAHFGSAFPDLDWHFGSVGSFLDASFQSSDSGGAEEEDDDLDIGECCEANPPFSPAVMEGMANHMIQRLHAANNKKRKLTFVVVVPTVKKNKSTSSNQDVDAAGIVVQQAASESFQCMVSSEYCTSHIQLSAREHGYIEGAQHLRPTQYKQSSYDTSVILLQSQKARECTNLNLPMLGTDLKDAFVSRHQEEIHERKKLFVGK